MVKLQEKSLKLKGNEKNEIILLFCLNISEISTLLFCFLFH